MSALETEIEIIRLEDQRNRLGMMDVGQLPYDERVKAMAQYRLGVQEIDRQIRELRSKAA